MQEIELSELASMLLSNVRPMVDIEKISIQTALNPLMIKSNHTLIEVLLTNLFHNAIRHTTFNGKVSVEIKERMLTVKNTGIPLIMDADKMFERFSKEGKSENSSGLGLAIVKKICDTCSYNLSYHFREGVHIFSITF